MKKKKEQPEENLSTQDRLKNLNKLLTKDDSPIIPKETKSKKKKREGILPTEVQNEINEHKETFLASKLDITLQSSDFSSQQKEFLINYIEMGFHVTNICAKIGVTRQQYYNWRLHNKDFNQAVEDLDMALLDQAVYCIQKSIKNMDAKSAQFVLKALDKRFKEKIDITSNGQSIGAIINIINPNDGKESNQLQTK